MTELWRQAPLARQVQPAAQGAAPSPEASARRGWEAAPIESPSARLNDIDRETGAGAKARFAVSLAEADADRLAVARQFYPDAQLVVFGRRAGGERLSRQTGTAYQEQAEPGEEHIVFTHPDTGKPTTFNPRGRDWGDVAEFAVPAVRAGAYMGGAGLAAWLSGGNPTAMAAGGTAASQGVKYLVEPVVEWATGLKIPDSRALGERVAEGLADVGLEFGASFGGELVGAALQKVRPKNLRRALDMRKLAQQAPPGQGRPGVVGALEQMAVEQGVPKDKALRGALPLATRGESTRSFFQAAAKFPKSAETIAGALDDTYGVIRRDFERIQRGVGSGVREPGTAGQTVKWGLKEYAQKTAARQKELEDVLEKAVGSKTRVPMQNTATLVQAELAKVPAGAAKPGGGVVPPDYLDLMKVIEANGGELPFDYVRAFRESIGEATSGGLIAPTGAKTKWYDPLYGALTNDMKALTTEQGGASVKAFAATQTNWAQREARLELLRTVANSPTAERAFRAALSGADDGPSLLTALKASVPKDAWDDLVAVKLWDMGATARGADVGDEVGKVFSPTRFIGNWANMSDASKAQLFPKGSRLRSELDRLATVTAALRESRAAGSGRIGASGTPQGNVYMDMLGDGGAATLLSGDPRAALVGAGTKGIRNWWKMARANEQALLLTDPDFVRWLADGAKAPPTPAGTGAHLRRLSAGAFAAKPPALKQALMRYLEDWHGTLQEAGGSAPGATTDDEQGAPR